MNTFHINTTVLYSSFSNYLKNTTNILPLTNDKFSVLVTELNAVVKTSPTISVSIYGDAAGTNKIVNNNLVLNINYTYEHDKKVADTVMTVDGAICILFKDGTKFATADTNATKYWYSINGGKINQLV